MPSVSADAEASALSEFVAVLLVGDKSGDRAWGPELGSKGRAEAGLCSKLLTPTLLTTLQM